MHGLQRIALGLAALVLAVAIAAAAVSVASDDDASARATPTPVPGTALTIEEVLDAVDRGEISEYDGDPSSIEIRICGDDRVFRGDPDDPALEPFFSEQDIDPDRGGSYSGSSTC